ncbi:rod shape-determining protein [Peptostreptococcaceae bacterium OttesenSCG-928-C18]|nr:rod shape-determining protein [Peptostreptococcaceae bacterium OttesenSCG-928-C18]
MPSLLRFFAKDLGIDLGTGNTIISDANGNILVNEPSVVAIDLTTYEILAVGIEAKNMLGKTPGNIMAVRPLDNGVIADFELTQAMLTFFVKKANSIFSVFQPKAVITVPSFLTDVEKRSVEDVVIYAGCRDALLIEENIAAAIGMGLDINEPRGHLISNIGAGTIQSSIISLAGVVSSKAVKYGGDNVDRDIRNYIKKNHNLLVGNSTCEYIKNAICTLKNENLHRTTIVSGKDLVTGMPKTIELAAESLLDCVVPLVNETISSIRDVLEKTPPEISREILMDGIILCGGVSSLDGLAEAIEENLEIKTNISKNPINLTGVGVGKAIKILSKKATLLIGKKDER